MRNHQNNQSNHNNHNNIHKSLLDDNKSVTSSVPSIPEDASQASSNNDNSTNGSSSNNGNARSNLLAEIRKGKELRKTQAQERRQQMLENAVTTNGANGSATAGNGPEKGGFVDVANVLLSRRMFLKDSSDDDTSTFGTEGDDDDW